MKSNIFFLQILVRKHSAPFYWGFSFTCNAFKILGYRSAASRNYSDFISADCIFTYDYVVSPTRPDEWKVAFQRQHAVTQHKTAQHLGAMGEKKAQISTDSGNKSIGNILLSKFGHKAFSFQTHVQVTSQVSINNGKYSLQNDEIWPMDIRIVSMYYFNWDVKTESALSREFVQVEWARFKVLRLLEIAWDWWSSLKSKTTVFCNTVAHG